MRAETKKEKALEDVANALHAEAKPESCIGLGICKCKALGIGWLFPQTARVLCIGR
jgi:hypothetical protein